MNSQSSGLPATGGKNDMEIQVTINPNGDSELLALNTREDLFQDYTYFLNQAKATPNQQHKILLHKRFLRAALLALLAYYRVGDKRLVI